MVIQWIDCIHWVETSLKIHRESNIFATSEKREMTIQCIDCFHFSNIFEKMAVSSNIECQKLVCSLMCKQSQLEGFTVSDSYLFLIIHFSGIVSLLFHFIFKSSKIILKTDHLPSKSNPLIVIIKRIAIICYRKFLSISCWGTEKHGLLAGR